MAGRKRVTVLKALELLQSIQEDDSDVEIVIESDAGIYNLHEDNRDNSEGKSSFDNESLVSEFSNSEIWDFEDNETNSKSDEDHVYQNNTTSFATSDRITWDLLNPNQKNSERQSCHNVITEALGPPAQAHCSIIKESVCSAWDLFIDESMLRRIQRCTEEEARRVLQTNDWCASLHRRRRRLKGIHSRSYTNRTGAEGLSFYYPRLLHCLDQTLAVMSLSQHRVSSSKTVRPRAPCGVRCIGHAVSTWSAVCS